MGFGRELDSEAMDSESRENGDGVVALTIPARAEYIALCRLALTGIAQAQSAVAPPSESASMPHDCAKPMAKHSHAAEKGTPVTTSKSGPCAPVASATTKKDKTKHDHAKDAK